jgi:hypothetical protein
VDIDLALQQTVDDLVAAGIRAVLDERDVNPPCVFVTFDPSGGAFDRLSGTSWSGTIWLRCVVPGSGRKAAWRLLGPLVEQVRAVLPVRGWSPQDLISLDGGDPLPAITLTYPVRSTS